MPRPFFKTNKIMKTILLLIFSAAIIWPSISIAKTHAMKKLDGETIHHYEKDLKAIFFLVFSILVSFIIQGHLTGKVNALDTIAMVAFFCNVHWFTFDLSMNLLSGEKWNYISDNNQYHNDAWSDKMFHWIPEKHSGNAQMAIKGLIFVITLLLL